MNLCCSHTIVVVNTEIATKNCIVIGGVVALLMMGSGGYLIFHLIALVISSSSEKIIGFQVSAKISGEECVLDSLILIYSSTGFHLFTLISKTPVARFK